MTSNQPSKIQHIPFAKPFRPLKTLKLLYPESVQVRLVERYEKEGLWLV
jgi:hypothetical protein